MKTIRKSILISCILLGNLSIVLLLHTACSSNIIDDCTEATGENISINRDMAGFIRIENRSYADIVFVQSAETTMRIEGQEDVLAVLTTEIENNTLIIASESCIMPREKVVIYLSGPELSRINIMGSGSFSVSETLNCSDFTACISGSGEINIQRLNTEILRTSVNGSGKIQIRGNQIASRLEANISGSGDVKCQEFPVEHADVSISGSGSCYIFASEELIANIFGSGNIYYHGEPSIDQHLSGSGNLIRL